MQIQIHSCGTESNLVLLFEFELSAWLSLSINFKNFKKKLFLSPTLRFYFDHQFQYNSSTLALAATSFRWNLLHMTMFRCGLDMFATILIPAVLLGYWNGHTTAVIKRRARMKNRPRIIVDIEKQNPTHQEAAQSLNRSPNSNEASRTPPPGAVNQENEGNYFMQMMCTFVFFLVFIKYLCTSFTKVHN